MLTNGERQAAMLSITVGDFVEADLLTFADKRRQILRGLQWAVSASSPLLELCCQPEIDLIRRLRVHDFVEREARADVGDHIFA